MSNNFKNKHNKRHREDEKTAHRPIRSIVSEADYAELSRYYQFVPSTAKEENKSIVADESADSIGAPNDVSFQETNKNSSLSSCQGTWQERMVAHYHEHLYKDYVLADFTRIPQLGLRWRTRDEVVQGIGSKTCGNKHCRSKVVETNSKQNIKTTNPQSSSNKGKHHDRHHKSTPSTATTLSEYEVPFAYVEHRDKKMELVKLTLCNRCKSLLFQCYPSLKHKNKSRQPNDQENNESQSHRKRAGDKIGESSSSSSSFYSSSSSSSSGDRRRRSRSKKRKRK